MTLTTGLRTHIAPAQVHDVLRRSLLVDGFHVVIDLDRSHGSFIVDARDGKEYLDLYTYFATLPLGHNHPRLQEPEFQKKLLRAALANPANSDIYTVEYAEFVDTFRRLAQPAYLPHAFFVAGGALGVENALKAAFDWKVRKNMAKGVRGEMGSQVIHFQSAFHGRTGYTMSMTNTDTAKTKFYPKFTWPRIENPLCLYPLEGANLKAVEEAEARAVAQIRQAAERGGDDIAALIIEPIQGEGGDQHFRGEFFRELRRLADTYDFMLIYDEVQTGVGLTGKFWCHQHFPGAEPDALAFGKKTQVCGMLAGPRFDEVEHNVFHESSRINSTWGGNLVDMVRAQCYLEVIEEESLVDNAARRGETLQKGLRELEARHPGVTQARGRGLMAAFDLPDGERRGNVLAKARDLGLLALSSGPRSIRFRPALNISDGEVGRALDILDQAIRAVL